MIHYINRFRGEMIRVIHKLLARLSETNNAYQTSISFFFAHRLPRFATFTKPDLR